MALIFPSSPTIGDIYPPTATPGLPQYKWDGVTWIMVATLMNPQIYVADAPPPSPVDNALWWSSTDGVLYLRYWDGDSRAWVQAAPSAADYAALTAYTDTVSKRNRIINGAMQVSQENGNTAGTAAGYFAADMWATYANGAGVMISQRVQAVNPSGSRDRYRVTVSTADAAIIATDFYFIYTRIEASRMTDLLYGLAAAKTAVFRFGWKGPAGTYGISLANNAQNYTYVTNFTISAAQTNTDTEQSFVIPGPTAGTWTSDNNFGLQVQITLASGRMGTTGWQAVAGLDGATGLTNNVDTVGKVFELFDVSLTEGTVAPPFVVPDYASELLLCKRYWKLSQDTTGHWQEASSTTVTFLFQHDPEMRLSPTIAIVNGTGMVGRPGIAGYNVTAVSYHLGSGRGSHVGLTTTTAAANTPASLTGGAISFNARM